MKIICYVRVHAGWRAPGGERCGLQPRRLPPTAHTAHPPTRKRYPTAAEPTKKNEKTSEGRRVCIFLTKDNVRKDNVRKDVCLAKEGQRAPRELHKSKRRECDSADSTRPTCSIVMGCADPFAFLSHSARVTGSNPSGREIGHWSNRNKLRSHRDCREGRQHGVPSQQETVGNGCACECMMQRCAMSAE